MTLPNTKAPSQADGLYRLVPVEPEERPVTVAQGIIRHFLASGHQLVRVEITDEQRRDSIRALVQRECKLQADVRSFSRKGELYLERVEAQS
jgi:hypothetical protein